MRFAKDYKPNYIKVLETPELIKEFKRLWLKSNIYDLSRRFGTQPSQIYTIAERLNLPARIKAQRNHSIWRGINKIKPNYTVLDFRLLNAVWDKAY